MKKIYIFCFAIVSLICYSQSYSSLLKNANWTIMKIQWDGVEYDPPAPFVTSGKVIFNDDNISFKSLFFNSAGGNVAFGDNNSNYFNLMGISVTLAQYGGENEQAVNQFDNMTTGFYFGYQPTDKFYFEYEEIFSAKKLTVTNPLGYKIFYSNLVLANSEVSLNKEISIYPNPAKDEFFIKSALPISEKINVEIYDLSGKLFSRQQISSNDVIDIKSLHAGNYLVKITGSKFNYFSQLIVKK